MQRSLTPVVLTAAAVLAGYIGPVQFLPFEITKGQSQLDTNMIRAQDYLAKGDPDTVLVGSSLSFRLPLSVLGPHIANLAFSGGSPGTGLEIIERSGKRPKLVLVEINVLSSAGIDPAPVSSLFRFPDRQLRVLRALRSGYDPINVVMRQGQALFHREEVPEPIPSQETMQKFVDNQRQGMLRPPDARLRRNLDGVAALVSELEARGIRVGFFEMPIDLRLAPLPLEKIQRDQTMLRFRPGRYCWIHPAVPGGAHTLDGIHLTVDDATLVAKQVVNQRVACLGQRPAG